MDRGRIRTSEATAIACAAAIVVAIGWSRIYDPFAGDQALFLIGAEKLHAGGVLYRDFWDIKQPGVFAFFLVAGRAFGFTQIGEHVADALWQLAFAGVLIAGLRACVPERPAVAAFAPLAVAGAYYAGSSSWHLMQVEELVGLPLFCSAWLLVEAMRRSSRSLALVSGICGGIVLAFKVIVAPVLAGIACAIALGMRATGAPQMRRALFARWIAGLLAPLALVAAYAIRHATGATTFETTFVIPIDVLLSIDMHAPLARLADSATRFLLYYRGLIVLAAIGLVAVDRTNALAKMWRLVCFVWIVAAVFVIAIQISSWWQYHFLLLIPPLGILATFGLDFLIRFGRSSVRGAVAALALGAAVCYVGVPLPQFAIETLVRVARERPFASTAALERYRASANSEYADALEDAATVADRAPGTTVYVFGDPLIYVDAHTTQPIAMNSWAIALFTPELWTRTVAEFGAARPDYVFVFDRFAERLRSGDGGAAMAILKREYVPLERTRHGRWFAWHGSPAGTRRAVRVDPALRGIQRPALS